MFFSSLKSIVIAALGIAAWCALSLAARARGDDPAKSAAVDFAHDIRPILAAHCFECHGEKRNEGGLRLTSRASALAGGDSGQKAIVASDSKSSRLVRVINGADELQMPPEGEGQRLTAAQVELITRWVNEGAVWPAVADQPQVPSDHWAWRKPQKASLPAVRAADWARHPIDRFVLARLEAAGIAPAPEADRYTLVRRVYLDLVGLPPTPEAVEAFVADTRPGAYERLVDRALADPGYGERWARVWLDLARYADSKGYGSDPLRTIWRYRDWVIEAFNRNLPFDQFTVQQLAGDLLPEPTSDMILATAFHRNTMANDEGGTDDEEFRVAAVKDRAETSLQVWMGLTLGCAKCHSHKFDPITQREYYQAYAFFDQTEDTDRADETPQIVSPSPLELQQIAQRQQRLTVIRGSIPTPPAPPAQVNKIFEAPASKRTPSQVIELARYYWAQSVAGAPVRAQISEIENQIKDIEKRFSSTPIMRELPPDQRRVTHTMIKGNFRAPGDVVEAGLPAAFHPLPAGAAANRLGLAHWLVSQENPLTARVMINRLWARLFGLGIVATEEDFGTQGLPPTQPEVLDWLAIEFMDSGWDIKEMLRQIVTSATYRQNSSPAPAVLERDPDNHLLARGPRFRLEAEMVRDQALATSGLLCRKQGGASVYPPQPPNLWRAAFNGQRTWATSAGEDRYRRGLYTYWRRTVPYPSMAVFDAPSREICTMRRISTNTPLQAFVTLNDPVYVEAAQALARRIVEQGGQGTDERAAFALRLALSRPPRPSQVNELAALYYSELTHYRQDAQAALEMATEPLGPLPAGNDPAALAAWTVVSNVILNLDGVLTKR